jgi:hypothetical protein
LIGRAREKSLSATAMVVSSSTSTNGGTGVRLAAYFRLAGLQTP